MLSETAHEKNPERWEARLAVLELSKPLNASTAMLAPFRGFGRRIALR
jgi:hypothetical protein